MFTRLTKMQIVAMWSLMAVLFGTGDLVAATLTGSGSNLPIPAPNPGGPPGVSPTLTVVTGAFTGVWTAPAQPPWVGTFSATGPVPNSSSTGTTSYDFTTLPTGVLPAGTFFLFNDVDYGSVTGETFDLRAWDTSASLITSPWLDEPIGVWGSGTGSGGAILPTNMPGWDWNSVNPSTYRIDGTSVSGGNPTVTFALVSNQPIATMELVKGSTFDSFGLQAPISVPEPASIGLACLGMLGLGIFAGRRRSGSCRGGSNMKTWITVAAIIVSGLLPGEAWAVQKEIFGLASESDGFHILRYDVTGNSFYDCGTVASSLKPTTNLAMDANRRLYYMDPFQGGHEIWKADLDGSNNLINQQYVNTLSQNLDIVDGFTIGPNQDLYMTGYGHSEIYRYDLGVNNGLVTTEVTLVAGPSGTVGEFRSDLAFDPLTNYLVGIGIVPDGSGRRSLFQIPNALVANGLADNYVWEFFGGNSSPWASATFDLGSPTNPSGPLGENPDGVAFDPTNGDLYLSGDGEEFSLWDRSNATLTNYLVGSAGQDTGLGYDLAFQTVTTVPEPATWALLGICAAGAVVLVRRRSRRGVATAAVAAATAIALAVGSAAPVEASNIMINGGFELPANPNTTVGQYNESLVPGWETSASDDNIEIWSNGYGGVFAAEGNQHAELNATEVSTLYQDVSGIPANATVGYSFAHRGRLGVDTLRLTISDLGSDNAAGGSGPAADTTLFSQLFSTGNTAWVQYSAPTIGNLTLGNDMRFAFESVSAAGGNQAIGNFLDNVQFGVDVGYVVPEPATAALSLGGLAGLTLAARRRRRAPPGQRCCT